MTVVTCDDKVIPLQELIGQGVDDSELEEVFNTERHLLYVACTSARDRLIVMGVEPTSEFLDDMTYQQGRTMTKREHAMPLSESSFDMHGPTIRFPLEVFSLRFVIPENGAD